MGQEIEDRAQAVRGSLGDPGSATTSVWSRTPTTCRDRYAAGKSTPVSERIFSARPGTSNSTTSRTASGVRSLGATPVPPVRTIRSAWREYAVSRMARAICCRSSARIWRDTISCAIPDARRASSQAGPPRSSRSPAATPSDTVMIATRIVIPRIIH